MRKLTKEQFIEKSNYIHNNLYDYSLVIYKNCETKVKIICKEHGAFEQTPHSHLSKNGCVKCKYEKHAKLLKKSNEDFIKEAKQVHGDKYDYALMDYKHGKHKVKIICKEHGEFLQNPNHHLSGHGCLICSKNKNIEANNRKNQKCKDIFITKANKIHNNRFIYLEEYESCFKKIKIQCNECEKEFYQTPANHLMGQGCPHCMRSKAEKIIENILNKYNINFIPQYTFKNCIGKKRPLPFDFYLPEYNKCIEYQGIQHYEPTNFHGIDNDSANKNFKITQNNDKIKKEYCINNNIDLLEISYENYNTINTILERELQIGG